MTVDELKRFKYLSMEIREIENRKKALENALYGTDNDGLPDEYTIFLAQKKAQRLSELYKIEAFINTIPDPCIRLIFALRYISMLTWQKIAFKIGHYDEQYPRKLHKKYMESCQNSCSLKESEI